MVINSLEGYKTSLHGVTIHKTRSWISWKT